MQSLTKNILTVALVAAMVTCAWLKPLDSAAAELTDAGLKRALISFATARALNAVISVAQGTELAVEPGGVGVNFTPGQLLDPLNDLVEQFGNLMLVASLVFGAQKVLIAIGANWLVSLSLSLIAAVWAAFRLRREESPAWLSRLLLVLLIARFAIPVVSIGSDAVFQNFLAEDYQSSQRVIDTAAGQMGKQAPAAATTHDSAGALEKFKGWLSQNADLKGSFEKLQQAAEQTIDHIIRLMVIFLLQTLVIPLFLLWAFHSLAKGMFEYPARRLLQASGKPAQNH